MRANWQSCFTKKITHNDCEDTTLQQSHATPLPSYISLKYHAYLHLCPLQYAVGAPLASGGCKFWRLIPHSWDVQRAAPLPSGALSCFMQQGAYKAYKAYTHCTNDCSACTPNTCAPQQAGSLPSHALPMSCYMQSGIRVGM